MTRSLPQMLAVGTLLGLLSGCARAAPATWIINETASVPRGLYRLTSRQPDIGDLVALCVPASAQPYRKGLGAPPGARLLKRVVAGPGDDICRTGRRFTWPRGAALALIDDRRGQRLPAWQGCRQLAAGELAVLGDTALSFDSRYFGAVRAQDIEGVYEEVWRW